MSKNSADFEGIKKKFWENISRIDTLEPGTPERRELLRENNNLLERIRVI